MMEDLLKLLYKQKAEKEEKEPVSSNGRKYQRKTEKKEKEEELGESAIDESEEEDSLEPESIENHEEATKYLSDTEQTGPSLRETGEISEDQKELSDKEQESVSMSHFKKILGTKCLYEPSMSDGSISDAV